MWSTIAGEVSNRGPSKNIQNCKLKLRTLKDAYNKCKAANNNPRHSGSKLKTCPYYEELDALLSDRPCTRLTQFHEVGVFDETSEDGVMDEDSTRVVVVSFSNAQKSALNAFHAKYKFFDKEEVEVFKQRTGLKGKQVRYNLRSICVITLLRESAEAD